MTYNTDSGTNSEAQTWDLRCRHAQHITHSRQDLGAAGIGGVGVMSKTQRSWSSQRRVLPQCTGTSSQYPSLTHVNRYLTNRQGGRKNCSEGGGGTASRTQVQSPGTQYPAGAQPLLFYLRRSVTSITRRLSNLAGANPPAGGRQCTYR